MSDAHEARMELGQWFQTMLKELDEDGVEDAAAIDKLKGMVAKAFADWRLETGYGLTGLPPVPPPEG